jgi:hypothetical protein
MRAAMGKDAWRLVGHDVWRVNDLSLQTNFLVHMLAVLNLQGLPGFFSH